MLIRIIVFLLINFGALGIGGYLMGDGPGADWYRNLNQAPWTPPGWVFGAAWTTIMICFSIYLAYLWPVVNQKRALIAILCLQWILNIAWNPAFFNFHMVSFALVMIIALTILVIFIMLKYYPAIKAKSALILPYALWLCIATTLNAYILIKN
jgi:translocator protein